MNAVMRRLRHEGDDEGIALVLVIGLGLILSLLIATMITTSIGGLKKSSTDVNSSAAMAAAYAGIEDYQSKLANDNTYEQYGNAASTFSNPLPTAAVPKPTVSKFTGLNGNPAFGFGSASNPGASTSTSWAVVFGSSGRARYRYEVDNSQYYVSGTIRLRSTGLVGNSVRTEVADLRQNGFINYLYYTDYEVADPALSNTNCVPTYDWQKAHSSKCTEIQFAPGDVIKGPVHSNDSLLICGTAFQNTVESGLNRKSPLKNYNVPSNTSCGTPTFSYTPGYAPVYAPPIAMPATNLALLQETRSDLTSTTVPRPGCLYTGPTSITFNTGGTMTVRSPWTRATNITEDANGNVTGGSAPTACGTIGAGTASKPGLASATGQTIPVIANNLIFVQNVPRYSGASSSDLNAYPSTGTGSTPSGLTCTGLSGSTGTGNGIGYPTTNEAAPTSVAGVNAYGCDSGDVFVKGTEQGQVTVAAANYVYVTGSLTYDTTNAATNILGLIGQGSVWVWNPVDKNGNLLDSSTNGLTIDASILSVAHTFTVQNYAAGPKGTLTVSGSIAQEFRGPVAQSTYDYFGNLTGTNGYLKNYVYDNRLKYTAPPKFLTPVSTSYGVTTTVETKPAFNADGSSS